LIPGFLFLFGKGKIFFKKKNRPLLPLERIIIKKDEIKVKVFRKSLSKISLPYFLIHWHEKCYNPNKPTRIGCP